nr:MAG TPA: hypothetical protein [Caudoviricetes sp.]
MATKDAECFRVTMLLKVYRARYAHLTKNRF